MRSIVASPSFHVVVRSRQKIDVVAIQSLVAAQNIYQRQNSVNCNRGAAVLLELLDFLVRPLLARREFKIFFGFRAPLLAAVDRRLKPLATLTQIFFQNFSPPQKVHGDRRIFFSRQ